MVVITHHYRAAAAQSNHIARWDSHCAVYLSIVLRASFGLFIWHGFSYPPQVLAGLGVVGIEAQGLFELRHRLV